MHTAYYGHYPIQISTGFAIRILDPDFGLGFQNRSKAVGDTFQFYYEYRMESDQTKNMTWKVIKLYCIIYSSTNSLNVQFCLYMYQIHIFTRFFRIFGIPAPSLTPTSL